MRYFIIPFVILFNMSSLSFGDTYDRMLKDYKKQMKMKNENLVVLEKKIEKKKHKKKEYEKRERKIKKSLNKIESKLGKIRKQMENTQSKINKTEKKLNETKQDLEMVTMNIEQNNKGLCNELDYLYRRHYSCGQIFTNSWMENLRMYSINNKIENLSVAKIQKMDIEQEENQYKKTMTELIVTDKKFKKQESKQKKVFNGKNVSLKRVSKMKRATQKEIKKLNSTTQELQKFIKEIEKKKKNVLELKKQEEMARKEFKKKRGYLPWPVQGELVARFGRIKHPKLDTKIICNGIRIASLPGSDIYCIDKGEIVYAKNFRSYGKTVIISHGGGVYTIYGLLGQILVKEETKISYTQPVGKSSKDDGIVYFEVRIDGTPKDPLLWLKKKK